MFKNALLFRIEDGPWPQLQDVEQRLDAARFVGCGAAQPESVGWVAPRGDKHAMLAESVGGQVILRLCTERKTVPGSAVKDAVELQLDQIEAQTGRRPKGKAVRELKEQIVHTLLPRAFPQRASTWVWIDARAGWVLVDAASLKKADAVLSRLTELLGGGIKLKPLQTALSPATAMTAWLSEKEAPAGFSLDRDCELKQPDAEKPTVRFVRHALDIEEVQAHIQQGKLPTQLALTWGGRVSFVLHESGTLKKIKLLDVVMESQGAGSQQAEDGFDADVAIATGELRGLIPDLVAALGGFLAAPTAPLSVGEVVPEAGSAAAPKRVVSPTTTAPWDPQPA